MPGENLREQVAAITKAQNDLRDEALDERFGEVEDQLHTNNRLRNLALATAIVCMVAAGFSAGYALTSREQLKSAKTELAGQIETNQLVVCSSARSTALAFREPQVSSDGTPEPQEHFINRMLAQRSTLQLAVPLHCTSLKGFATFPYLRAKALYEIQMVLHEVNPRRFAAPVGHPPVVTNGGAKHLRGNRSTGAQNTEASQGGHAPSAFVSPATEETGRSPPGGLAPGSTPHHETEHSSGHETGQESSPAPESSPPSNSGSSEASPPAKEESTGGGTPIEIPPTEIVTEEPIPIEVVPPHKAAGVELLPEGGGVANVEVEAVESIGVCLPGLLKLNCRE